MRNALPAAVLALSLGAGLLHITPASAASTPGFADTAIAGSGRIAYKEDNSGAGVGALLVRVAGGIVLMTALAFAAAVLAKRYLPGIRGYSADGKGRIQLLESRRVTPKLTLFVIEYEGRRLLLAQSGDRVVEIGAQRE